MQGGAEPKVEDAVHEIAALLASAYRRRARIRLVRMKSESVASTEGLDNTGEQSVHELTLTSQRKESTQP
jgi:hypothetical protein